MLHASVLCSFSIVDCFTVVQIVHKMIESAREDASKAAKDAGLRGDAATKFVDAAVSQAAQAAANLNSEQNAAHDDRQRGSLLEWIFGICSIIVLVAVLVFLVLIFMLLRSQQMVGYARVDVANHSEVI